MSQLRHQAAVAAGRLTSRLLRLMGRQASTLPGKIALQVYPGALGEQSRGRHIILVTGTNGKTTTTSIATRLARQALPAGARLISNEFGANLASGMMTTLLGSNKGDYVVLECDEAAFASKAGELAPEAAVVTNIFRDQLDRYGELDTILRLLTEGSQKAGPGTKLILCADDPNVASIASKVNAEVLFFGAAEEELARTQAALSMSDAAHCPRCGTILEYTGRTISHMGDYSCPGCGYKRPSPQLLLNREAGLRRLRLRSAANSRETLDLSADMPLEGLYNAYNAAAAILAVKSVLPALNAAQVEQGLAEVKPAFGRLERIPYKDRELCFVLVKNPAGMEQGIRLLSEAEDVGAVLFFLNNRINDGVDVSWIWDAPMERFALPDVPLGASGERAGDMALRLDYACGDERDITVSEDAAGLVMDFLEKCPAGKTVYLLPNYSAMMDLRRELSEKLGYNKIVSAQH